jgi:tetratricopeptide (TPR) repeat protein
MGTSRVLEYLGDYKAALVLYEQVLETQIQCLGTGHAASVGSTYHNTGLVEEKLGNYQKALELYEKALEHRPQPAHAKRPDTIF